MCDHARVPQRVHQTLSTNTVKTFTVTGAASCVKVTHLGNGVADPIYVSVNATPTVQGNDTYSVASGQSRFIKTQDRDESIDVNVISAGAAMVSVEIVDPVGDQWAGA